MATAKKCDICSEFYDIYNDANNSKKVNGFVLLNIDSQGKYFSHKPTDCCPECMNKILGCIDQIKNDKTPS